MPIRPSSVALTRATSWPSKAQAALAAGEHIPTEAELAGIDRGLADARDGRFATDEQVAAVFARHRRP